MPCHRCWLASERSGRGSGSRCGVARKRRAITLHQDCPPWHPTTVRSEGGHVMFVIGIDPHKRSHTAAVLDDTRGTRRPVARQRGSLATRPVVAVRGSRSSRAPGRSKPLAVSARCSRSSSSRPAKCRGCAADVVGAGAAARLGPDRQVRPARRPFGRDRRAATRPAAPGPTRRPFGGAAPVGEPSPRPHRVDGPGRSVDSTPCSAC